MKSKTNKTSTKIHKQKLEIKKIKTEVKTHTTKKNQVLKERGKKITLSMINHHPSFICTTSIER